MIIHNKALKIFVPLLVLTAALPVLALSPQLTILSPRDGEVISGEEVVVQYSLKDFNFVDFKKNPEVKEGEGHMHLWLDEPNPTRQNAAKLTTVDLYVFSDIRPGERTLAVELVDSQHNSLKPRVSRLVKFSTVPAPPREVAEVKPEITPEEAAREEAVTRKINIRAAALLIVLAALAAAVVYYLLRSRKSKVAQ